MKQRHKWLVSVLFALAMVLGLVPGLARAALADAWEGNPYAGLVNTTTTVTFNGRPWYVIADGSTAADAGTLTLLAADTSFGLYKFDDNSNDYDRPSAVKTYLSNIVAGTAGDGKPDFSNVASAIGDEGLYLLSEYEVIALGLSSDVLKMSFTGGDTHYGEWWLRSYGYHDVFAAFVDGVDCYVNYIGIHVFRSFGVRPALKLNLSSVIFESESKSFSLKPHAHSLAYAASGATITATCTAKGCTDPAYSATLQIAAPEKATYGDSNSADATVTDEGGIRGEAKVMYQTKGAGAYGEATQTAPANSGAHRASVTLAGVPLAGGGTGDVTAYVEYEIAKADPTAAAPTGITATYGQTLADVSLEGKNPQGNTAGTWAWADGTQGVGDVVSPAATFKATFTPDDATNYSVAEDVDVAVTVKKAANPTKIAGTATVVKGGNVVELSKNVKTNGATGDVRYAIEGEKLGCSVSEMTGLLTSGDDTGTVTVKVTVAEDGNHLALEAKTITVTVTNKQTQTITATDVSATYGDAGKKVAATTDGDGKLSYEVTSGDAVTVDKSTGALAINKVGTATVTVTAAETASCAQATKDVNVSVAPAAITSVSKPADQTYTGKAIKPAVTVKAGSKVLRAGTDYTLSYKNNTSAGTATVIAKGKGNYTGTTSAMFRIVAEKPAAVAITSISKPADQTYTGKAVKPSVTVKAGKKVLKAGTDYTVSYKNNVKAGTATVTARGKGNYTGTKSATFKIRPAAISSVSKPADQTYTGKAVKPSVTVKAGKKVLKAGTDYTVSYKNNVKAGTATVTARGKGNYTGTKSATFKIRKAEPALPATVVCRGWIPATGGFFGTTGQCKLVDSVSFKLKDAPVSGGIEYRSHIQGSGWEKAWSADGAASGKAGSGKRVEAVRIRLTGQMASTYDVYYRAHVQRLGWMAWAKNGAAAGTEGQSRRLEAVQIVIVRKGATAPGASYKGVTQTYAKAFVRA